jgi:hypothetical protein
MEGKMIRTTNLMILSTIFAIVIFLPNFSEADISSIGYDFGQVEVGSTKTTGISITNLDEDDYITISLRFANVDCSYFSVGSMSGDIKIIAGGTVEVVVSFTPSTIGTCSDTLRIYAGKDFPSPINPYTETFTGTGIEAKSELPMPFDVSRLFLTQIQEIKSFMQTNVENGNLKGAGKGKWADKRLKALNKMLIITSHLIENGYLEAARNKLIAIYKKTDSKANPKDFVEGKAKEKFASKIQQLTETLDFN